MGMSKAELRLRRLLAAQVHQTNDAKLVHYVSTMRDLLSMLTGDVAHRDLPSISAARAKEYAQQIELVAQKLKDRVVVPDVMDTKTAEIGVTQAPVDWNEQAKQLLPGRNPEPSKTLSPSQAAVSQTLRRRLRGEDGNAKQSSEIARVDAATQALVQKHRELQEGLTDEMVVLAAQLKDSSMLMDVSLQDTEHVLDSTEAALEHSLASTNRVNLRAGRLYSQSWKTTCLTWLLLFLVCGLFLFMVFLIRVT